MTTQEILEAARAAKTVVALASSETRTHALWAMSDWLCHPENMEAILAANAEDMAAAKGHISDVMLDRLALTEERIGDMARGILEAAALPDPVGRVLNRVERPNGLVIEKTAVPVENAKVPCIQTGTGICHIFVDDTADQDKALDIIENAKASRPSVCNAEEVCLVHSAIAAEFLPKLAQRLGPDRTAKGLHPVELRLDERAAAIIPGTPAGPQDFDTEFLDYILAVKVVDSVDEAIAHIAAHSTGHSEAILTRTQAHADRFTAAVDSAAVYVNCSTRFTDGGEFGLGCEMGISTQKLHARGPMGLEELCSYKYIIHGDGQIR